MEWREYQRRAQEFFATLRMDAQTDVSVQGARGTHALDVLVRFAAFGVDHLWVVECKYWKRPVPKEKVLALKSIVDDLGADRGFLLSESGFQSGAVTAARLSNVTLTNLEDLRVNAEADIQGVRWDDLYGRLARLQNDLSRLTVVTKRDAASGTSRLKPGVSSGEFFRSLGEASVIDRGLQRARLGRFPIAYGPDETGEGFAVASDLATFLDRADEALGVLETWAAAQVAKPWPNRPTPAPGTSPPATPIVSDADDTRMNPSDRFE